MNAKATPSPEEQKLDEFVISARHSNPIFDVNHGNAMMKATSVLYFLKRFILKDEDQGISEDHAVASSMILQCAISALELHVEFQERKSQISGGAA
ncbi:MAG: hypothetical protein HPY82_08420 [Gammaproteobacteria bacterium]|nr:hypothetical protein [Gammaproteobacteria bacterium]